MAEIPGEDRRIATFGHRHDRQVGQVRAGVLAAGRELEGQTEFGISRRVELVDPIEK